MQTRLQKEWTELVAGRTRSVVGDVVLVSFCFLLPKQSEEKTHGSCWLKNKIIYPVQGGDDNGPVELEFEERRDRIPIGWERGWDGSVGDKHLRGPTGQEAIALRVRGNGT